MHLTHLSLADFRSYAAVDVQLDPGISAFVGPNGQGKTNLVEAVGYLATLGSHRVASDAPLVRMGAERAIVRAAVRQGDRRQTVELELNPGRANRARINRSSQVRPRDVLGIVRVVLFAPEDLALVKGDPGERRRFLDELITARTPRMAGVRSDYERVLKQRNTLLKTAALARRHGSRAGAAPGRRGGADLSTLDVWDQHLARAGAELLAQRLALIAALQPLADKAYEQLAPGGGPVALEYKASAPGEGHTREELFEQLMAALADARKQEIERGVTLVGPHRDDLVLRLGRLPAKGYASHGESWSCALALRLASYDLLRAEDPWNGQQQPEHGPSAPAGGSALLGGAPAAVAPGRTATAAAQAPTEDGPATEGGPGTAYGAAQDAMAPPVGRRAGEPVLVLDDVFAELDARRRERLAELVAPGEQVLVTAAVDDDVPAALAGRRYTVAEGRVEPV